MAHWSQQTEISPKTFVTPTSRYANSKVRHYTEKKLITFEIYKRRPRFVTGMEEWVEITEAVQYRPDLVSQEIYGTPDLWWSIMEFNGMKDILEFKTGRNIMLPGDVMV